MTLTKLSTFAFLLFGLFACNQASNKSDNSENIDTSKHVSKQPDNAINNNEIEKRIIDTILKLNEIKNRAKYIEQQTKGERHFKVWVADAPHLPEQKYYWIKAGEDYGTDPVVHFNFYVYPDSMIIMYHNPLGNSSMTLEEWRKISGL